MCQSTRYVALRQRDLYHIENERSEFISNFAKAKYIERAKRVYRQRKKSMEQKNLLREETINLAI